VSDLKVASADVNGVSEDRSNRARLDERIAVACLARYGDGLGPDLLSSTLNRSRLLRTHPLSVFAMRRRSMKQTRTIDLFLMPILASAALAAGCGTSSRSSGSGAGWQTCVDQQNRVVDEQQCVQEQRSTHVGGYMPIYRWYYYPYGGSPYPIGYGVPLGGSYSSEPYAGVSTRSLGVPAGGRSAPHVSGARFGGFGSTASGSAGE
jgi:hypothetical protein